MALLEIHGNGESSYVSQDAINSAIELLEDPLQKVERRSVWILTDQNRWTNHSSVCVCVKPFLFSSEVCFVS